MKIARISTLVILLASLSIGYYAYAAAADEKNESAASQEQGWFCPWAGQGYYGMGPGMMGQGYGSREGWWPGSMMGPGYGHGGMMGYGPGYGYYGYNRSGQSMTMEQTKVLVEHYLDSLGNPNLKLGKITDKGKYYEAEVVTKDNSLVNKLMVDKKTGWMKSVY
jgi:hypothetical protein